MTASACWPTAPVRDADARSRPPGPRSVVSTRYAAPGGSRFTVQVGLGRLAGRRDLVWAEIGHQLDDHLVATDVDPDGQLVLTLAVGAADLWTSVLVAMAAVTRAGYIAQSVEARPAPSD